ncbi:MAG: S-adenosylmethionine tRNA ribosyltransferase [Thalassobius sp.]|nr:S-adenosylmethionine tRNA ribosyltransferase [Thalassovita sp.]
MSVKEIDVKLEDYQYELPKEKIAAYPLKERDSAKLLVYKDGEISHDTFKHLGSFLDKNYSLFFNNTKVLPARMHFRKDTGAIIEVFLLHPEQPTRIVQEAMLVKNDAVWACTIGNLKRWKDDQVLSRQLVVDGKAVELQVQIVDREKRWVKFSWNLFNEPNSDLNFVDVVEAAGNTPLPPYLNRAAEDIDETEYQTVYGKKEGAVAAPTAGLHFTDNMLEAFKTEGRLLDELTLHVGAGTFQPVKVNDIKEHEMHCEQIVVYKYNIENLLQSEKILAVGTTSMRTMESIYWYGVQLIKGDTEQQNLFIKKLYPYQYDDAGLPSRKEALQAVLDFMETNQLEEITGETEILIMPGYDFKICDALITNFHLPESTLILLIAAFIGEDWRKVYEVALNENYRFLSYGDGSLLIRN